MGHKDLRFAQIVYILVFYNISFSWLLPLDGFQYIFLCRVYCVTVKMKNKTMKNIMDNLIKSNCRLMTPGGTPLSGLLYKGMCHWAGYGFFTSLSQQRYIISCETIKRLLPVVLNRVCIFGFFCPKKDQG